METFKLGSVVSSFMSDVDHIRPCRVSKHDGKGDTPLKSSFFQRIGKYIVLFSILGLIAVILTFLTVSIATNVGGAIPVYGFLYFDFNIFFTYMIGFIITPIIIVYVTKAREKTVQTPKA